MRIIKNTLFLLCLSLFALNIASARTINISDRDPNEKLATIPEQIISSLRDSGIPFRKLNNGIYAIGLKNIYCQYNNNSLIDTTNPEAGISSVYCRYNLDRDINTKKGKLLSSATSLFTILADLELTDGITGGRTAALLNSLNCTVDTKVEALFGSGRIACNIDAE